MDLKEARTKPRSFQSPHGAVLRFRRGPPCDLSAACRRSSKAARSVAPPGSCCTVEWDERRDAKCQKHRARRLVWWRKRKRDARTYVGEVAVRLLSFCLFSFHQQSVLAGEDVAPLLLPEALVYRHDVTLRGEDVLVVRLVKRIVLIEQLQSRKNRESVFP